MPRVGIVHTSFALVEPLGALSRTMLPGTEIVNIVDDTLLTYVREHGVDEKLTRRMCLYFQGAVEAGADLILSACSSVGETVDVARTRIEVPILKIDEPMSEAAVAAGGTIAVLATLASTLGPTCRLLEAMGRELGGPFELRPRLCEGAFDLLLAGNSQEHDDLVAEAARQAARDCDVILFAQASMARLRPLLEPQIRKPLLFSPEMAMKRIAQMLSQAGRSASMER
jgi:Asp/Glu/hydantoin racemase